MWEVNVLKPKITTIIFIYSLLWIMRLFVEFKKSPSCISPRLNTKKSNNSIFNTASHFPIKKPTITKKRKLAAVSLENWEEHYRNSHSRNASVPWVNGDYITQISDKIECKFFKKMSHKICKMEYGILGSLCNLDRILSNRHVRTQSGTVSGTSRNTDVENQEQKRDRYQNEAQPKVGSFVERSRYSNDSDQTDAPHMAIGVQQVILFCSPGTSSGKQKKTPSGSQTFPQWKHPCDNWNRPNFGGPSTVGGQYQFWQLQQQHQTIFRTAQNTRHDNAHKWREFREIWTVWRHFPNKS